jgi:hypothetical protein
MFPTTFLAFEDPIFRSCTSDVLVLVIWYLLHAVVGEISPLCLSAHIEDSSCQDDNNDSSNKWMGLHNSLLFCLQTIHYFAANALKLRRASNSVPFLLFVKT